MGVIFGVGNNDADYPVRAKDSKCPYFIKWMGMMSRCYGGYDTWKSYVGCVVCDEWLTFSIFKAWMETQDWEGKVLDKDILGSGKLYSPETCVFVTQKQNNFLLTSGGGRGKYPLGCHFHKQDRKFRVECHDPRTGKQTYYGSFEDPQEAHEVWREKKLGFVDYAFSDCPDNIREAVKGRYRGSYDDPYYKLKNN